MVKTKYEKKVIEGKEVRIKTIYQPHGAEVLFDGKTITLNEKTKKELKEKELDVVLLHERGHLTFINGALTWLPLILIFGLIIYLFFNYGNIILNILFTNFPVIFTLGTLLILILFLFIISTILNLIVYWIKEIHADWYAVKRTNKDILRKTLKRIYNYNKKVTKPSFERFYGRVILHPPQSLRLKIIRFMEKVRDRKH